MPKGKEHNIRFISSGSRNSLEGFSFRNDFLQEILNRENLIIKESESLRELENKTREALRIYLNFEQSGTSKTTTERKRDLKLLSSASMQLSNRIDNGRKDKILATTKKLLPLITQVENTNISPSIDIIHLDLTKNSIRRSFFYEIKRSLLQLEADLKIKNTYRSELAKDLELFSKCCDKLALFIKDKKYNYPLEDLVKWLSKLWVAYTGKSPNTRYDATPEKFKNLQEERGDFSIFYYWAKYLFKNGLEKKITRGQMDGILAEVRNRMSKNKKTLS